MADETHSTFLFESQRLLDMSTPSFLNTQSNSCDSGKLQSQTGTALQQNDMKFQTRNMKPASSARELSEYQHFRFSQGVCRSPSKDQRPHSFYSWNSLLNIQESGSQKHGQNDLKSGMGSLFRSLLTVISFGRPSSSTAGRLDTFTTSVSRSLLHIHDIPEESLKEMHRDSVRDTRTHSFRHASNESFTDTRTSSNSFTEITSDFITDITNDSFTDVSSDSVNDISHNAFNFTSSNSLNSQSSAFSKDVPGDLFKYTPGYVYEHDPGDVCKDIPENLYKGTPCDVYTDTPLHLYTDTPGDLYKDALGDLYNGIARGLYKETQSDLDTDLRKDVSEDTSKYSYNNTSGDSFEETLRYSLRDASGNLLRDTLTDSLKDMPADSFTDAPVDSLIDTLKDSSKDELRDLLKDARRVSLKDAQEGWLKNTITDSLKHKFNENCIDASSIHKTPKTEHTFDDKQQTTPDINTTVYFSKEHQFLETTSSPRHQWKTSTAKQETWLHLPASLTFLGFLANFLFIAPCVVAYWNSTWCFFDYILLDYDCQVSVWTSAALGFPLMAAFTFFQNSLLSFSVKCNSFVRFVLSRTYTYILSVACISEWRSIWIIANCYVGRSLFNSAVTFAVVFFVLLLSRCLASLSAPPVFKVMEVPHAGHYRISTFQGKTVCILDVFLIY